MAPKSDHYYQQLIEKYLTNECNSVEAKELFDYLNQDQSNKILLNKLQNEFEKAINQPYVINNDISKRIWNKLESNSHAPVATLQKRRKWLGVAAAVIAMMTLSAVLYMYLPQNKQHIVKQQQFNNDIVPGGNKAILTLADGSKIVLDDIKTGTITTQGNTAIKKTKDGQLIYDLSHSAQTNLSTEPVYNTITTPKGGQYQVILPDGSTVWLNAASSLKFPTAFRDKARNVELDGEAYFEITKNKSMPFKVTVNNMKVEVLGTHFNVMAYQEESYLATTLLEGSVKISGSSDNVLLTPGHQAILNKGLSAIKVLSVDTEEAVAWKNGYFLFNNENIQSIMRKISRWYNVEVSYEGNMNGRDFTGTISRFKNVSEVLKLLELTNEAHFKIEGRRITVMP